MEDRNVITEMKCPRCGGDMKEFVTKFRCRNLDCRFEYKLYFRKRNTELVGK